MRVELGCVAAQVFVLKRLSRNVRWRKKYLSIHHWPVDGAVMTMSRLTAC